jgi:hypothetical protein
VGVGVTLLGRRAVSRGRHSGGGFGTGSRAHPWILAKRVDAVEVVADPSPGIGVMKSGLSLRIDSYYPNEMFDRFGGVHVSFDNVAISLNSSEGITNSVEIAPKIAEAIGGVAHNA